MSSKLTRRMLAAMLAFAVAVSMLAPVAAQDAPATPAAPAAATVNVTGGQVQLAPTVNYDYARVIVTVSVMRPVAPTANVSLPASRSMSASPS